jgi:hypothetical protein
MGPYRRGVTQLDLLPDLLALRDYRRAGELTVRAWVRSVLRRHAFQLASLSDPLPALARDLPLAAAFLRKRMRRS